MNELENKLIKSLHCNNKNCAIETYRQIFLRLEKSDENSRKRNIKNYLIFLNSFIYGSLFKASIPALKKFKGKNSFISKIENIHDTDKLFKLGEDIILFYIDSQSASIKNTRNPIVREAIKYIHLNSRNNISLEEVSKSIHISKNHLSFLFSKCLNTSFTDYLNKTRVDTAKILLIDSDLPILHIAMECGFNSQSYFCSVFKKYENMTPKKYRNINQISQ